MLRLQRTQRDLWWGQEQDLEMSENEELDVDMLSHEHKLGMHPLQWGASTLQEEYSVRTGRFNSDRTGMRHFIAETRFYESMQLQKRLP